MVKVSTYNREIKKVNTDFFSSKNDFDSCYQEIKEDVYILYKEPFDNCGESAKSFYVSRYKSGLSDMLEGTDDMMMAVQVFEDYEDATGWLNEYAE